MTTKPRSKWRHLRSYRVYAVLTVCRILYSSHTRDIVSKPIAARWAITRVPFKYRTLIQLALRAHTRGGAIGLGTFRIRDFIEFAKATLHGRSERPPITAQPRRRLRPTPLGAILTPRG